MLTQAMLPKDWKRVWKTTMCWYWCCCCGCMVCCRCWYIQLVWIVLAARCGVMVAVFVLVVGLLLGVVNASTRSYALDVCIIQRSRALFWCCCCSCCCLIVPLLLLLLSVWRSLRCTFATNRQSRIADGAVVGLRFHICVWTLLAIFVTFLWPL